MKYLLGIGFFLVVLVTAGCAAPGTMPTLTPPTAAPTTASVTTAPTTAAAPAEADLSAIKSYLVGKTAELKTHTAALTAASNEYFELAKATNFDYAALWENNKDEVIASLTAAREAWKLASPTYEQTEGIVAGTPSLVEFDVILDAGASAEESPDDAVHFDLTLEDGRVLEKPGNLFGVTESTLYGTEPDFTVPDLVADFDGNGTQDLGDSLPDAYVLKAGAELLEKYAGDLDAAANAWSPTDSDAFSALVVMVPTMGEYFDSWKNSRFVSGEASTQRDFVAISRLSDIIDILGSLQVVYSSVQPQIAALDSAQAAQLETQLSDLKAYVQAVYTQEQSGKQYTPEEADTLGAETQNRATAIAGEIAQVAERLDVEIVE
jgi:hypothetical protein